MHHLLIRFDAVWRRFSTALFRMRHFTVDALGGTASCYTVQFPASCHDANVPYLAASSTSDLRPAYPAILAYIDEISAIFVHEYQVIALTMAFTTPSSMHFCTFMGYIKRRSYFIAILSLCEKRCTVCVINVCRILVTQQS